MLFDKQPLTLQYVVDSFSNTSKHSVRQRELHIRADCTMWGLKVRVNVPCCNWTDVYGKSEVQLVQPKLGKKRGVRSKHQSKKKMCVRANKTTAKNKRIKINEEFLVILKSAEEPEIVFKRWCSCSTSLTCPLTEQLHPALIDVRCNEVKLKTQTGEFRTLA